MRPREKLLVFGSDSLSDAELLAIIIQTGTKQEDVVSMANRLILKYGSLSELLEQSISELCTNHGVGKVKASKINSLKQISISTSQRMKRELIIDSPEDVYAATKKFTLCKQEHLIVICLDTKNAIICINDVLQGTINQILIHPREVFYPAIKNLAKSIILVHNHPSGNVKPSNADLVTTDKLIEIAELIGISIEDHIIITEKSYYSICQEIEYKV